MDVVDQPVAVDLAEAGHALLRSRAAAAAAAIAQRMLAGMPTPEIEELRRTLTEAWHRLR